MLAKTSYARELNPRHKSESNAKENRHLRPIVAMTVKLPREVYLRLKSRAAERGTTGQSLMLEAVRQYLSRIGGA